MLSEFRDMVEGKTVAVVGNALSLIHGLDHYGVEIEKHDVIVRMNMGIPGIKLGRDRLMTPDRVGVRTDVWATAKYFGLEPPCRLGLFMKLTALGDQHWKLFQKKPHAFPMVRWTQDLEDEVKEFVGADPGTGVRLVYFLKRHANPKSVNLFGMDCWKTPSHWSMKPNTPNHVPGLENAALRALLA